jgi:uncharacterized membrane protein
MAAGIADQVWEIEIGRMRRMRTAAIVLCSLAAAFCLYSSFYFYTVAAFLDDAAHRPRDIYNIKAWASLFVISFLAITAILIFWKKPRNNSN